MAKRKSEDTYRHPDKDQPWIANYPPLEEWLLKNEARCMWQLIHGNKDAPNATVEGWMIKGKIFVVQVQSRRMGWEIFTHGDSNLIAEAFEDAERRLGIK